MVLVTRNTKRTRRSHLHHSPVNKAVVVTDQENRTFVRDVLHVQHADSIAAEHKAKERSQHGLRQIVNRPDKHTHRNHGKTNEVILRTNIGVADHHREHEQERHKHHSLDQVSKSNHGTGVVRTRVILQQRIHRHKDKSTKETGQGVKKHEGDRMHKERHEEHADRSTKHAKRHKAGFNKVLGEVSSHNRTNHESHNRKRHVVLHHVHGRRTGHVLVNQHEHLSQSPEHRKGDDGGTERRHTETETQVALDLVNAHVQVFELHARNHEVRNRTKYAHRCQNPRNHDGLFRNATHGFVRNELVEVNEVHADNRKPGRRDNTANAEDLEEGVRIAQIAHTEHFLDNGVLSRTVDRKSAAKPDREPECDSRVIDRHEHRLRDHKQRHHE